MVESAPSYTGTLPTTTVRDGARRYRSLNPEGTTMKTAATLAKINTALQDSLLATVDALSRRRACDIPEQTIDRFVAMRWLQWNGGTLRLTSTGEEMVVKVHASMLGQLQAA